MLPRRKYTEIQSQKNVPDRFSIKCFPVSSHWSICGGGWWSTETANAIIKSFPIGCHNNTWGVMIYQRRRLHLQSSQFVNCFYQGLNPLHLQHTTNSCYNKCLVNSRIPLLSTMHRICSHNLLITFIYLGRLFSILFQKFHSATCWSTMKLNLTQILIFKSGLEQYKLQFPFLALAAGF